VNKIILIIIIFLISLVFITKVSAEIYKYIDENGTIVLTDNANNIPKNQRSKVETFKQQKKPPKSDQIIHANCREDLTSEELQLLKQRGESEKQIQYIKCTLKAECEQNKVWSEEEKHVLDKLLRLKWNQMMKALGQGDIDTAVSYFIVEKRDTYRKMFSAFPKKMLPEMSRDLSNIHMDKVYGNHSAIYEILSVRNGKTYSFQLKFERNCDGEWEIQSY